jgi:DNA-3-methyladenine glycosylase II
MPPPQIASTHGTAVQSRAAVRIVDPSTVFETGRRYLMRSDPRLAAVIRRTGRIRPSFDHRPPFEALVRAVISQQLSTKAADTIRGRVMALLPTLTPEALLTVPVTDLRAAGLSGQKIAYLRDLSERVADGRLDLHALRDMRDEEIIEIIVAVKGFGVWTAQMFLMFSLHRPDILPTGDLGIVKGMQRVLAMKRRPSVRTMERAAKVWQPYRSIACWYLWRSLEMPD